MWLGPTAKWSKTAWTYIFAGRRMLDGHWCESRCDSLSCSDIILCVCMRGGSEAGYVLFVWIPI